MLISRRTFLNYAGPLVALPLSAERCAELISYENSTDPFLHGVASGDPARNAVVIWTRVTGDDGAPDVVGVRYRVASDPECQRVVASGVVATDAGSDFTVKVDVSGLKPGTTYYYRFESLGFASVIGRTRTLPASGVKRLRFAVMSCSNYPYGYFNAYASIAARADLDAVLHLGDYLYEYANGEYGNGAALGREPQPSHEIVSLADYRTRHAQYKTDPDLQEAHRQHPFIAVWDDHEIANDAFEAGAENHQPETEGDWQERQAAAAKAYFEWMPIRPFERDDTGRVYRSFAFGELVDLVMLDTRNTGRDEQVDPCDATALRDPSRELLGASQHAWLVARLLESKGRGARWRLLGQQVLFAQLLDPVSGGACVLNADAWDGYAAARARVLSAVSQNQIDNVVILTGDFHTSWACDIAPNPFDPGAYDPVTGEGSLAVEFVAPGVTSPGVEDPVQAAGLAQLARQTHPHVKFAELNRRGYVLLDITKERVQAEWYHLLSITERTPATTLAGVYLSADGQNRITVGGAPSLPRGDAPELAPAKAPGVA